MGPHEVGVLGDLEGLVAHETLGERATSGDGGVGVGDSAPAPKVSKNVVMSSWIWVLQDSDVVATVVVDDGVTGHGGGNEGLKRNGAEEAAAEHFC